MPGEPLYLLPDDHWMRLAKHDGEPCVTLMVPLHPSNPDRHAVRIDLQNAVDEADRRLAALGVDDDAREAMFAHLDLPEDPSAVPRSGRTLVALLSPSLCEVHQLDASLPRRVEVTHHFALSDLKAALDQPPTWHVLALSDDEARLYRIDQGEPTPIDLPLERPDRAAANAERVDPDGGGPAHAHGVPSSGASPGLSPHTFGDEQVDDIERATWHEIVVDALAKVLPTSRRPLVLVADVQHHADFRTQCHLDRLILVPRQPHGLSAENLRDLGRPHLDRLTPTDIERLQSTWHQAEHRTASVAEALQAAQQGRIGTLLWNPGADVRHLRTDDDDAPPEGAPDLVDEVVRQTVLHGGDAIPVPPSSLPAPGDRAAVNAVLRW